MQQNRKKTKAKYQMHSLAPVSAGRRQAGQGRSKLWSTLADQWLLSVCSYCLINSVIALADTARGLWFVRPWMAVISWLQRSTWRMCACTSADLSIGDINPYILRGMKAPRGNSESNGGRIYITEATWNMEWNGKYICRVSQIKPGKHIGLFSLARWLDRHTFMWAACPWLRIGALGS